MALLINFSATEYGGTDSIKMQGSTDGGSTWIDATVYLTLTVTGNVGERTVTDTDNLAIDTTIFIPGNTYQFRLIDQDGITVSNIINYTIPSIIETEGGIEITTEGGETIEGE